MSVKPALVPPDHGASSQAENGVGFSWHRFTTWMVWAAFWSVDSSRNVTSWMLLFSMTGQVVLKVVPSQYCTGSMKAL